jgi:hypothetical protein
VDGILAAASATSTSRAMGPRTLTLFNDRLELNFRNDQRCVVLAIDEPSTTNGSYRSVAVARTRIARPIPIHVTPIFSNTARLSCNTPLIMSPRTSELAPSPSSPD